MALGVLEAIRGAFPRPASRACTSNNTTATKRTTCIPSLQRAVATFQPAWSADQGHGRPKQSRSRSSTLLGMCTMWKLARSKAALPSHAANLFCWMENGRQRLMFLERSRAQSCFIPRGKGLFSKHYFSGAFSGENSLLNFGGCSFSSFVSSDGSETCQLNKQIRENTLLDSKDFLKGFDTQKQPLERGCLGYAGTIVNHYKDPGSLLNNQYFMEGKIVFSWLNLCLKTKQIKQSINQTVATLFSSTNPIVLDFGETTQIFSENLNEEILEMCQLNVF